MLIPYGTDAPIYHLPFATVAMILLNLFVFFGLIPLGQAMPEEQFERLVMEFMLVYGEGLRPWQWVTSNFMHADILHLLGNMFCLWGFGIVVEGKVGWWRFLLIFFGIGIGQCAVEQTLHLFADGGASLGASAIIYGLLAVSMVWAPQNEMNCVLLALRIFVFDITIYALAIAAFFIEAATSVFAGLTIGSQILHLMGAVAGFGVGVVMLRRGWVDCEGWDLFTVWHGREQEPKEQEAAAAAALLDRVHRNRLQSTAAESPSGGAPGWAASPPAAGAVAPITALSPSFDPLVPENPLLSDMRAAIAAESPQDAFVRYQEFASDPLNWPLPEKELTQIITLYHQQQLWSASVPAMLEHLRTFTNRTAQVRLKLGHILLEADKRPGQAWQVLSKIDPMQLSEKDRGVLVKLKQRAQQLHAQHPQEPIKEW